MTHALEGQLDELVGKLDLERKVRLLTGRTFWSTHPEPAIGLRAVVLGDGPSGVRGAVWDDGDPSACLPSPTAIAASWDPDLAGRMGAVLAAEAGRKQVDVVLAPTVNLHRSPLSGRHFECWSEDPLLTGTMAAALVGAVQRHGVGACVKHYVANDSETDRDAVDVRVDERVLREVYLAPFEQVVRETGVWMLMAAYNAVNGTTMTEHELLTSPLRVGWGFDGVVVSDWRAARSTVATGRAGLDLSMPGPDGPWGPALVRAVERGEVDEVHIDAKVRNLLRLAARVGALTLPGGDRPRGAAAVPAPGRPAGVPKDVPAEVRAAAREGMVLLRNEGGLLPLDPSALRRVAVIGELAAQPRIQGGGSAHVNPPYTISPLDGVREAFGEGVEVVHVAGYHLDDGLPPIPRALLGDTPLTIRWLREDGALVSQEHRSSSRLVRLGTDVPPAAATVEVRGHLRADRAATWQVGFIGAGHSTFAIDGNIVSDGEVTPEHDGPGARILTPPSRHVEVDLAAGQTVELLLRHRISGLGVSVGLGVRPPRRAPEAELEAACLAARDADAVVVVVGTSEQAESEGYDRRSLDLPGGQDELVDRVAAENPRTVVVVNAGAPVLLPWRHGVPAVLLAWFGGQEVGRALADVLLGAAEPGGRLPTTWPDRAADVPVYSTTPTGRRLDYREGVHVGYRAWLRDGAEPAYPFGHGLGYTSWELTGIQAPPAADLSGLPRDATACVVTVDVRNTGDRAGKQVVQVYLAREGSAVDRPARWLAGFAPVRVNRGEAATVEIPLPRRAFEHWSPTDRAWVVEPGTFEVMAGVSAADVQHTKSVDVSSDEEVEEARWSTDGPGRAEEKDHPGR